jgi:tetratricopeptide (TPR) repeat protein
VSDDSVFVLYALAFRVAVLATGAYAMFLGYCLLKDGERQSGAASSAEASLPGIRFKLKNATAGSIFSLFGAVLIVAMILHGNPEKTSQKQMGTDGASETEKVRGSGIDPIQSLIQSGQNAFNKGATDDAANDFRDALSKAAPALNGLAWIYVQQGKADKGLALSQSAVEIDNSNAYYLDTLAEAQFQTGNQASALKTIQMAAKLDPKFNGKVDELRKRAQK